MTRQGQLDGTPQRPGGGAHGILKPASSTPWPRVSDVGTWPMTAANRPEERLNTSNALRGNAIPYARVGFWYGWSETLAGSRSGGTSVSCAIALLNA